MESLFPYVTSFLSGLNRNSFTSSQKKSHDRDKSGDSHVQVGR